MRTFGILFFSFGILSGVLSIAFDIYHIVRMRRAGMSWSEIRAVLDKTYTRPPIIRSERKII